MSKSQLPALSYSKVISFKNSGAVSFLLFLNMFLVILGYGLAVVNGKALVIMQIIKAIVVLVSFFYVLKIKKNLNFKNVFYSGQLPIVFSFFILISCFWSNDFSHSINRALTLIIPMIYVYISVEILVLRIGLEQTMVLFHKMLIITFIVPLISYILTTPDLSDTNIYGVEETGAFVSNHYGWSSSIMILSILGVYKNYKKSYVSKIIFIVVIISSFFLIFISASRSSIISVSIGLFSWVFFTNKQNIFFKIILLIYLIGVVLFFFNDGSSGLHNAIERTELQQENGEARNDIAVFMFKLFNENPNLWITGIGFSNHIFLASNKAVLSDYHNSYLEILFGVGMPIFILFFRFMIYRPILNYYYFFSKWVLILPPLLIIPFFEFDITAGQFLFFPWFTFVFILNVRNKFFVPIKI